MMYNKGQKMYYVGLMSLFHSKGYLSNGKPKGDVISFSLPQHQTGICDGCWLNEHACWLWWWAWNKDVYVDVLICPLEGKGGIVIASKRDSLDGRIHLIVSYVVI